MARVESQAFWMKMLVIFIALIISISPKGDHRFGHRPRPKAGNLMFWWA